MRAAIDLRDFLVKETSALTRIAHAIEFCGMTYGTDERAPEQTLKIECHVWPQTIRGAKPGQEVTRHAEAGQVASGKNVDVINGRIAAEEGRPFGVDNPGNSCLWISVSNQSRCRQSVNDVA